MKKEQPLVSIIIPAYNGGRYLKASVQSVFDQDYQNIELMVFDDGSTDNTIDILKSYGNNFYWESHKNVGQSATLNKGWEMAKGEILSYLSVDDLLEPNAVSVSVEYLLEHPGIMMTYGDYDLIDEKGRLIKNIKAPEFDYKALLSKVIVQPGPGVFFRQEGFRKTGGWDGSLRQMPDYDYWLRLGLLGDFKRLPLTIASFRVHDGSLTYAESSIEKSEECLSVMIKYFNNVNLPDHIRFLESQALSNAHVIAARLHIRSGRYLMGFSHLFRAIEKDKNNLFSLRTVKLLLNAIKYRMQRKFFLCKGTKNT